MKLKVYDKYLLNFIGIYLDRIFNSACQKYVALPRVYMKLHREVALKT